MKKTAIISGASRGIGRSIAMRLAREGYFVIPLARNKEEIGELEYEIDSAGGKSLSFACDITDEEQVMQVTTSVVESFGRIDVVVNNAGIGVFKQAEDLAVSDWDKVMDTNVKGTFLLTKAALPIMRMQKSGHIVSIASDVSKRTFETGSLYCASKYAQDAFLSALRREVRKEGIKVSVIYPGLVDTYFGGKTPGDESRERYLMPKDIADAVAYIINAPDHVVIDEIMLHPIVQEW